MRMFRVQSTLSELFDLLEVDEFFHFIVFDTVDFAYFVRSSETVEEADKRNARFKRRKVSDQRKVHNFLNAVRCEHSKTGLAASHNVRVVAEDVKCMSCDASCRNVENRWKQFARDFVHIRNHKEQTLASRESAGQCACRKRTVNCACSACFGFHFGDFENVAHKVFSTLSCPFVAVFCHR